MIDKMNTLRKISAVEDPAPRGRINVDEDRRSGGAVGGGGGAAVSGGGGASGGLGRSPEITKMQEAIKAFADYATAQSVPQFNKYIEDTTLGGAKPEGSVPTSAGKTQDVFDALRAISAPKHTERKFAIDGRWGPNTNGALLNLVSLGEGLFKLVKAVNYQSKYQENSFNNDFKKYVPETHDKLTHAQKVEYAKQFVTHINALRELYEGLTASVGKNVENQAYMSGTGRVATYKAQTPADKQKIIAIQDLQTNGNKSPYAKTWYIMPSPRGGTETYSFNLSNIVNKESLDKWKTEHKLTDVQPQALLDLMRNAQMSAKSAIPPEIPSP